MREVRVAWAVVDGRNAELGEASDVGPTELRGRGQSDGRDELSCRWCGETGRRRGRNVGHSYVEAGKDFSYVLLCGGGRSVRGEPEVDAHDAVVGDDVAG